MIEVFHAGAVNAGRVDPRAGDRGGDFIGANCDDFWTVELLAAGMFWDELKLLVKNKHIKSMKFNVVFETSNNYRKLKNEELIGVRINFCGRHVQIF